MPRGSTQIASCSRIRIDSYVNSTNHVKMQQDELKRITPMSAHLALCAHQCVARVAGGTVGFRLPANCRWHATSSMATMGSETESIASTALNRPIQALKLVSPTRPRAATRARRSCSRFQCPSCSPRTARSLSVGAEGSHK